MRISVNVTVPKKLLADIKFRESIEKMMKTKTSHEVEDEFWSVTSGWSDDPNLDTKITSNSQRISAEISVFGNSRGSSVFRMVSLGTPPHSIQPKTNGGFLRFQPGYKPATRVGSLMSGRSSRFGSYVKARSVKHPGLTARNFDELIAKKYTPVFEKDVQDVLNDAFSKGWGS